jgi:hypothetical protein
MKVTALQMKIADPSGSWFTSGRKNTLWLAKNWLKKLKLKLRSRWLSFPFKSVNGDIVYGAFRVEGIYKTYKHFFSMKPIFCKE